MSAEPVKPRCASGDEPYAHAFAAALLAATVIAAYSSCVTGMIGYADDYWLLWEWRNDPGTVVQVWNRAGRWANTAIFQVLWSGAKTVDDLWRPRLAAVVGIWLLALGIYAALRRLEYSWLFAVAAGGLTSLLPTFAVYAAWATCSGFVYACLAALAAFSMADVRWRRPAWLALLFAIGAAGLQLIALCIYQPAGMFYVVACMFALASRGFERWDPVAATRVAVHGVVLLVGLGGAFLIVKLMPDEAAGIDMGQRAAFTSDLYHKVGRFVAQPLGQSCVPFFFVNHWFNATRGAMAVVVLGALVPLGVYVRLTGSRANRWMRCVAILAMIPLSYLPNLVVASDFFPFRTRAAIGPAVLFVILLAASGAVSYWRLEAGSRRLLQGAALAAIACGALIAARYHVTHYFAVPSQIEWALVRTEVLREARRVPNPQRVVFLMPDSSRPPAGRFVYDEFGYVSSSHEWTCRGMTGLAVADVAPQSLAAFGSSPFVQVKFGQSAPTAGNDWWIIDARRINDLAPLREGTP